MLVQAAVLIWCDVTGDGRGGESHAIPATNEAPQVGQATANRADLITLHCGRVEDGRDKLGERHRDGIRAHLVHCTKVVAPCRLAGLAGRGLLLLSDRGCSDDSGCFRTA